MWLRRSKSPRWAIPSSSPNWPAGKKLREDVAALRFEVQREHALAQRVRGLEELLGFRQALAQTTVSARVIAGDPTPYFRTVMIDRGTGDGVRRDAAVVSPSGVVGRVVGDPGPRAAKVQLLIDRNAAAGALIERTRAAGVVMGEALQLGVLRMEYVSNLLDVEVGDAVRKPSLCLVSLVAIQVAPGQTRCECPTQARYRLPGRDRSRLWRR